MEQAATKILANWQTETREQLCEGFRLLLDNIGATLVDFASKTESMSLQTNFFDAQQVLERQREGLLADFCDQLRRAESRSPDTPPVIGEETLSLLEHDDYERSVALETIASNCIQRNHQNFHAFRQRLSAVRGGRRFDIEDLPFNPSEVTKCLENAITDLDISSKVRLVLFTLFDRYVMSQLDLALSSINERLADAGVLPTIRYEVKRPPGTTTSPLKPPAAIPSQSGKPDQPAPLRPAPRDASMSTGEPTDYPPAEAPTAEQTMDAITRLVTSRRHRKRQSSYKNGSASVAPMAPEESQRQALDALGSTQMNQAAAESPAMGFLTDSSNKIIIDKELLFRVRNTLKKQRALINSLMGDSSQLGDREQNAIEIVGMLFEAMLDDQTLPDQLKALLSHLHTPFLKIAIKDPRTLSDTTHPARSLLGRMLQLGLRWVDPERLRSGLYPTLQHCVHSIIQSPESVDFRALEEELERKAAQLAQTQKVSEKRTLDSEKGRTMLSRARETAESATRALLQSHALPTPVRVFFQTVFTDYMSLLLLRNELNPNDPKCREALNAAVQLIENVDKSQVPAAREAGKSLEELIVVLLPHYQNKIEMFLEHLEHTITSVERELIPAAGAEESAEAAEGGVDEASIARVMEIPAGSWFLLQENPEEQPLMVKLLWSNPHTHHVLFVDQHGLKRAHLSAEEIVQFLDSGSLQPVDIQSEGVLGKLFSAIKRRLESTLAKGKDS